MSILFHPKVVAFVQAHWLISVIVVTLVLVGLFQAGSRLLDRYFGRKR